MKDKDYILERFVPALNMVLLTVAPELFALYKGSACRQTAILIANEMSQRMPEHKWQVFEGTYTGSPRGVEQSYDHAWVWSGSIFIDANHRRDYRIWEELEQNEYPPHSAFAARWRETSRTELPWREMLDDTEYYTSDSGRRLFDVVKYMADTTPDGSFDSFDSLVYNLLRPEWMDS